MAHALVHLGLALLDALRYFGWLLVSGLVAAGSCFYGGYPAYSNWRGSGRPQPKHREEIEIRSQVATGIADIEAYLAAQPSSGDHRKPDHLDAPRRHDETG